MDTARDLYIDLIKRCVANTIYDERDFAFVRGRGPVGRSMVRAIEAVGLRLAHAKPQAMQKRAGGLDNDPHAHTMVGLVRLDNIQRCVEDVLADGVPGDLIEAGVWRGGSAILMRAILKAHGVADRAVWLADSFEGLPPPDAKNYPADRGDPHHTYRWLAIRLEEVEENFRRYGLLDEQVRFLKGWFKDTLPGAGFSALAVARIDGDMYESTMDGLCGLYPRLSLGGYVILDDYGLIPSCRQAVDDFRARHAIRERILMTADGNAGFWRRER